MGPAQRAVKVTSLAGQPNALVRLFLIWQTHDLFRMIAVQYTCRSDATHDLPSWCLSGCSSNCSARNLARRSSGAQKSTSANCCSKRLRRTAHVAFIASAAASGLEGPPGPVGPSGLWGLDPFHAFDADSLDCDFSCVVMRARSASSRRVSHHRHTSSDSLLSSRHLQHSHLPIQ